MGGPKSTVLIFLGLAIITSLVRIILNRLRIQDEAVNCLDIYSQGTHEGFETAREIVKEEERELSNLPVNDYNKGSKATCIKLAGKMEERMNDLEG